MSETIVIVGAKRTPIGAMQGKFNSVTASQLGATAIATFIAASVAPRFAQRAEGCVTVHPRGPA